MDRKERTLDYLNIHKWVVVDMKEENLKFNGFFVL